MDNFVDGAAVARIGDANFKVLRRFPAEHVLIAPEDRICGTMVELLNVEGIVLEPAGALAIDALRNLDLAGRTVLAVSGGNFDFERLPDVKERALRWEGLKKYWSAPLRWTASGGGFDRLTGVVDLVLNWAEVAQ
ncbi:MAG: hypothetical protein H0T41_04590 [Rhodobacteraceae bacterium]|nr:hypothetical protein [Paracoccaceae bacterium]